MLTWNKRKRTARRDKNCPEKSTQKYFAVPSSNALEVGEMVTMVHDGTSAGRDAHCQRMDYLQVAWLLREKLNDLVDGDKGQFLESGLQSLLDMATSKNIVSVDPKMLNPVLWRTLPEVLLHLILARLLVPDIIRLRSLSKEWRRDMATVNSGIYQACQEASSTIVALVSHSSTDVFFVTICDITKGNSLYAYLLHLRRPRNDVLKEWPYTWTAVDACDGGLVCFISLWKPTKRNRLSIVVVNLLTRVQHELPSLPYQYKTLPIMVQIKVDLVTKCYKVVVVAYRESNLTIETYDSGTRQWTKEMPPWGSIFGTVYNWMSYSPRYLCRATMLGLTPCVGHFDEGKLEFYNDFNPLTPNSSDSFVLDKALEKNRMFLLWKWNLPQEATSLGHLFFITAYDFENQMKAWVKGKSYECRCSQDLIVEEPFAKRIFACDGFVMVILHRSMKSSYFRLLDLSTSEWSEWGNLPKDYQGVHHWFQKSEAVLCKALWNVIP